MNDEAPVNVGLDDLLADTELRGLRKAYHELEAFQLSDGHLAAKKRLKDQLGRRSTDETGS